MIRKVLRKHEQKLKKKANVVGTWIGFKMTNGVQTDVLSIIVAVTKKTPLGYLAKKDIVPKFIDDEPTDVFEAGIITAPPPRKNSIKTPNTPRAMLLKRERTDRWPRPNIPPGVSISHEEVTSGTFGCVVYRDGFPCILSNNHVIANSNKAQINDQTIQPGTYYDGQLTQDMIARLADFVFINFETQEGCIGSPIKFFSKKQEENLVDAAISKAINEEILSCEILDIGEPEGLNLDAGLELPLQKSGATTEKTTDKIIGLNASLRVSYGNGLIAPYRGQIIAGAMCAGGDSGSIVLDMNRKIVGLLFAGSETTTVINPIEHVFDLLKIHLS